MSKHLSAKESTLNNERQLVKIVRGCDNDDNFRESAFK